MALHTAEIDQNDVKTWLAYNDTTGLVENVRFDPVLNLLYVFAVPWDGNTPTSIHHAHIDQNHVKTKLGWDDTTNTIQALRCGINGELLIIGE